MAQSITFLANHFDLKTGSRSRPKWVNPRWKSTDWPTEKRHSFTTQCPSVWSRLVHFNRKWSFFSLLFPIIFYFLWFVFGRRHDSLFVADECATDASGADFPVTGPDFRSWLTSQVMIVEFWNYFHSKACYFVYWSVLNDNFSLKTQLLRAVLV